jgi:hypothetical protein
MRYETKAEKDSARADARRVLTLQGHARRLPIGTPVKVDGRFGVYEATTSSAPRIGPTGGIIVDLANFPDPVPCVCVTVIDAATEAGR